MTKQYNIGIDIGGTKVNIGVLDEHGTIIAKKKISSENHTDIEMFIGQIKEETIKLIRKLKINYESVHFIGVGVPGTVDMKEGIVEYCPNLFWEMIPLKGYLEEVFPDKEIKIIQDSWAAAIAEHEFGAGRALTDMACVTLGTGIGCGIILNDKIFTGKLHSAGEIGHSVVQKDGRPCNCGNHGCLEKYASGNGIFEQAYEQFPEQFKGKSRNAETVFELAYSNYAPALELIDNCVRLLAVGLANLVDMFAIEGIIISGGLCEHETLILDPLKKYIREYGYPAWVRQDKLKVVSAELGSDAPMIGTAFIYKGIA